MEKQKRVDSTPVRFHAKWASGVFRGVDGRVNLPSANRCLHVTLTGEELQIRMVFPFSLLFGSRQLGFKQNIPLSRITQVDKARFLGWWHTVRVTFLTETREQKCLELTFTGPMPQLGSSQLVKRDRFVTMMQQSTRPRPPEAVTI